DVIRGLAEEGMTMVLVTHEMAFAHEVAKSVAFMSDGVIVEMGPPAEVLVRPQNPRTQTFLARFHPFTRTFAGAAPAAYLATTRWATADRRSRAHGLGS